MRERYKSDSAIIVPVTIEIDTYLFGENYWHSAIGRAKLSYVDDGKTYGALANIVCGARDNLEYDEDRVWKTLRRLVECSPRTWRWRNGYGPGQESFVYPATKL